MRVIGELDSGAGGDRDSNDGKDLGKGGDDRTGAAALRAPTR